MARVASDVSLSSASSQRPPSWTPTDRELRKYASLFLRTDANSDGYVEAEEARPLCQKSRLEDGELSRVWTHADQDMDGRLTFPEFVVLVHLVSCARKGLGVPSLADGLPPQLAHSVATLAAMPQQLHA